MQWVNTIENGRVYITWIRKEHVSMLRSSSLKFLKGTVPPALSLALERLLLPRRRRGTCEIMTRASIRKQCTSTSTLLAKPAGGSGRVAPDLLAQSAHFLLALQQAYEASPQPRTHGPEHVYAPLIRPEGSVLARGDAFSKVGRS